MTGQTAWIQTQHRDKRDCRETDKQNTETSSKLQEDRKQKGMTDCKATDRTGYKDVNRTENRTGCKDINKTE